MRYASNRHLTSGNEPEKRTTLRPARVAKRDVICSDSSVDARKNAIHASVRMLTIDYGARSDAVTFYNRSVKSSLVKQVNCNGVARSDDLLRCQIEKKLNTFVLPYAADVLPQKTEVYYPAFETTYRLSTISNK